MDGQPQTLWFLASIVYVLAGVREGMRGRLLDRSVIRFTILTILEPTNMHMYSCVRIKFVDRHQESRLQIL